MRILSTFLLFIIFQSSIAQTASDNGNNKFLKEDRYWSIQAGVYANQYFGDLNAFSAEKIIKFRDYYPEIKLSLQRKFSPHSSYQVGITWSRLTASDFSISPLEDEIDEYTRNLSFRNDLINLDFVFRYEILSTKKNYLGRPVFTPYLLVGIGLGYSNPKGKVPEFTLENERFEDFGKWKSLRPLGTEGQFSDRYDIDPYSWVQLSIPVGIGASLKINNYWNINFDISYRYLTTDYIDDVSGEYVDKGIFDDPYALVFTDRSLEPNSANGRYPRDFELINMHTMSRTYRSEVDSEKVFEVLNGYGEEGLMRGDDKNRDFYLSMGLSLTYIITGKKKNK